MAAAWGKESLPSKHERLSARKGSPSDLHLTGAILPHRKPTICRLLFFFFFWLPHSTWSSWARDQIWASAATQAAAVAMPDPQPTVLGQGSNLCPSAPKAPLIPLGYIGNASRRPTILKWLFSQQDTLAFYIFLFLSFFFQPLPWHTEVPKSGIKSKPELWPMSQLWQC